MGRALRSPVSWLGIDGLSRGIPWHCRTPARSARWTWTNSARTIAAIACPIPRPRPTMVGSLRRYGQLSPVVVCLREETHEILDGFQRLAAARALSWKTIQAQLWEADERAAKAAIYGLNQTGRRTQEWEDAWIVHALVRDDGLTQVEVAVPVRPAQELGLPPAGPGREAGRTRPRRPPPRAPLRHGRPVAGEVADRQPTRGAGRAPP